MAITEYLFIYLFVIQAGQDEVLSFREHGFFFLNACMSCTELLNANVIAFYLSKFCKAFCEIH